MWQELATVKDQLATLERHLPGGPAEVAPTQAAQTATAEGMPGLEEVEEGCSVCERQRREAVATEAMPSALLPKGFGRVLVDAVKIIPLNTKQ